MRDFSFQTDDVVAAGRPDLVVFDKKRIEKRKRREN